ncbi:hypothetical protein BpHYR1_026416 [Brachionus plicatilis]|uniref:Uncharacterized protein n=1 Tax=Brachionus plicatilis TaxID=10195 RepID=A0A3M7PJ97_BRAPC|nr:hypothetical protein BpHYR1_026416 [Brachionus plicatilis]
MSLGLTAHFIDDNLDFNTHVIKFKQVFLSTVGDDKFDVSNCEILNLDYDEDENSVIESSDDETYS